LRPPRRRGLPGEALRLGAPLGRPSDRRFTQLVGSQSIAHTTRIGGHQAAYRRLRQTPHNSNDWYVVAVDPRPAGTLVRSAGLAPLGMAVAALALLLLGAITFRSS